MLIPTHYQVPCTKRKFIPLGIKNEIVLEAYSIPDNIRSVSRKYSVQPNQIRCWRKNFATIHESAAVIVSQDGDNDDNAASSTKFLKRNVNTSKYQRVSGAGRSNLFSKETIKHLKDFVNNTRADSLNVSLRILMAECKRIDKASCIGLKERALAHRLYRLLRKWDIAWRRGTHIAQNTRHKTCVIDEFVEYFQEKVKILDIPLENIYNADQTNVYYSMEILGENSYEQALMDEDNEDEAIVEDPIDLFNVW